MNKNQIYSFLRGKLQFYIFIIVAVIIPSANYLIPYAMFFWVLSSVMNIDRIKKLNFKHYAVLFFPFLFYLLHIVGLTYSNNLHSGLFDLEVKLSILFIPLVAVFISKDLLKRKDFILKVFVWMNVIISVICLLVALKNSIYINEGGNLIFEPSHWPNATKGYSFVKLINNRYSNFSYGFLSIFKHPSYFSLYILFSIIILIYFLKNRINKRWINYLLIAYFSVFIWLLGSRAGYFTYLISFFIFFLIVIFSFKKYWIAVGIFILGLLFTVLILSNSRINSNIKEAFNIAENNKSLTKDSDIRLWIWKSGFEVFKENFWFGVGTGDIDSLLDKKYKEYNLQFAEEHHLNTHNQYLDVAVKLGVIGLVFFLLWIFGSLFYAIKNKHFLLFFFSIILIINLFFEAVLNTIAGVSFVAFFYSLLYSHMIFTKKEKELN